MSSAASRRSCSPSQATRASRDASETRKSSFFAAEHPAQVLLAGRADRDRAGDRLRGRGRVDRPEAAHARAPDTDPRRVDAVVRGQEPRHLGDVAQGCGAHLVRRLAVAALVVGDRGPAAGGAHPREVAVVLLPRSGAVEDHHPRPLALRLGQPEPVRTALVLAPNAGGIRGGQGAPEHRPGIMTAHDESTPHRTTPSPRIARQRARATSRWAAATSSSWRASSARRPTSTPRTTSARARRSTWTPSAPDRRLRGRLRVEGSADRRHPLACSPSWGLSVDVASAGELHAALRAGVDPARIYLHGNNKTEAELRHGDRGGRRAHRLRFLRRDRPPRRDARPAAGGDDPGHPGDQGEHPHLSSRPASSTRSSGSASRTASPRVRIEAIRGCVAIWSSSAFTRTSARRSSSSSRT